MTFLFWLVFGAVISAIVANIKNAYGEKRYTKLILWFVALLIAFSIGGVIRTTYLQQKKEHIQSQYTTISSSNTQNESKLSTLSQKPNSDIIQPKYEESKTSAKTYNGWITVKIENELEFQIPPTMELQSKDYQNTMEIIDPKSYKILNSGNKLRIVAQQKGLNEKTKESFAHYARAIMIVQSYPDDGPKWGAPLDFTKQEWKEFSEAMMEELASKSPPNVKFIRFIQHPKIVEVNGVECVNLKYETQYNDNPIVENEIHLFSNGKKTYTFHTMIRMSEYDYWTKKESDIRNIVNTIVPSK